MYTVLKFVQTGRKGWQERGTRVSEHLTYADAFDAQEALRAVNDGAYYRVHAEYSEAEVAYREALTRCERLMDAIQHANPSEHAAERYRRDLAEELVIAAGDMAAAGNRRMAELAAPDGLTTAR